MSVEDSKVDVIEFDLDGIIAIEQQKITSSEDHMEASAFQPAIELIKRIRAAGYKVRINTARWEEDLDVTVEWLEQNGVPYDELFLGKKQYVLKIDDRCINPRLWQAMEKLSQILGIETTDLSQQFAEFERDYRVAAEAVGGK